MQSASIRAARRDDFPKLWALLGEKAEFDGGRELLQADPQRLEETLFGGATSPCEVLVAQCGDQLVGMATFYVTFSSFLGASCLWLDDLFVRKAYRGRGIGRELLARLQARAESLGARRIDWTVENQAGIGFYEHVGAQVKHDARLVRMTLPRGQRED